MKRILFVTRNVSYVGVDYEEFIKNLLLFLAKNRNLKLFLIEIEGHGKFENTSIYNTLKRNNIRLISFRGDIEDIASIEKVKRLIQIIRRYKIDTVHSFLFNSDLVCCIAKIGSQKMWQSLSKIESFDSFCKIVPSIKRLTTSRIKPANFFWVSSKTIDVSVALEKNTPEWITRKRIIDNEIEPIAQKIVISFFLLSKKGCENGISFHEKQNLSLVFL